MAKSPEAVAAAAVQRIQDEAYQRGRNEAWSEAYEAGWKAHEAKVAQTLSEITMPQQAVKRAAKPKSATKTSQSYAGYHWPSDVAASTRAIPVMALSIDQWARTRVQNALRAAGVFTVGDLMDISLEELVDKASRTTRPLGDGSIKHLLDALEIHGIKPVHEDSVG